MPPDRVFGFVVGLAAEAVSPPVRPSRPGGRRHTARGCRSGGETDRTGANALVSLGFAGGLDPALRAGTLVIPATVLSDGVEYATDHAIAAGFGGLTPHRLIAGDRHRV